MGMGDYEIDKVCGVLGLERLLDILDEGKQNPSEPRSQDGRRVAASHFSSKSHRPIAALGHGEREAPLSQYTPRMWVLSPQGNLSDCSEVDGCGSNTEGLEHTAHGWQGDVPAFL
mgnify:CR=1 FL=1